MNLSINLKELSVEELNEILHTTKDEDMRNKIIEEKISRIPRMNDET